ncbi:MAG TPA: dihydroneopterin aldolase [Ferruginibacter sp.]|nr:dihydroneopterin aldolase [Chitinophagaceae bacterium]HML57813.1 dihydroneopterin aldolase [Ferruginibacter sp.]HRN90884.1 dihydroneopterin aldolase [Ferruginibacter sp.]HRO05366.1 dihydroneopterin aldolase [Ferruginibacter sp.]HRO96438.1 dihydroneopterin aldolase [Ferruginibacter sp.]
MNSIRLHQLRFFAHHGVFEEETVLGGWFEADVEVFYTTPKQIQALTDTVDYVKVYGIIKSLMHQPHALLETLGETIIESIFQSDERIYRIDININKLNPPVSNFSGKLGVCISRSRNHS